MYYVCKLLEYLLKLLNIDLKSSVSHRMAVYVLWGGEGLLVVGI